MPAHGRLAPGAARAAARGGAAAGPAAVRGDKPRLTQVFVNLLANANKFAPEGSVVRIGAAADDAVVRAWVEDEGAGPAGAVGAALFERFRRGDERAGAGRPRARPVDRQVDHRAPRRQRRLRAHRRGRARASASRCRRSRRHEDPGRRRRRGPARADRLHADAGRLPGGQGGATARARCRASRPRARTSSCSTSTCRG